tara:strand:+ start:384 stop:512 length:129 start_codon:yes stop_codon:yes gene_type:complete
MLERAFIRWNVRDLPAKGGLHLSSKINVVFAIAKQNDVPIAR